MKCDFCDENYNHPNYTMKIEDGKKIICINCMDKTMKKNSKCIVCSKASAKNMRYVNMPEDDKIMIIFNCNGPLCHKNLTITLNRVLSMIKDENGCSCGLKYFNRCSYCEKLTHKDLLRCSRCKDKYYCSRDCQRSDWLKHKKTCVEKKKLKIPKIIKT